MTAGFDPATPNMARVYDYWLGGKDHYPADRAEAERLLGDLPAGAGSGPGEPGVRDPGGQLGRPAGDRPVHRPGRRAPRLPAVHQAARTVLPAARVAYVDIDPVVLSHARALLATSDGVSAVAADLRDPGAVLADPELRAVIDPARPVCVILGAVLHFLDADAARAVTAGYARLMAPGSCLVISVASVDDEGLGKQLAAEYTAAAWHNHTPADVDVVLRRAGAGGPGRHRGADMAGVDAPAGAAAPRGPRAGRRGTASSLTSSASALRAGGRPRCREACAPGAPWRRAARWPPQTAGRGQRAVPWNSPARKAPHPMLTLAGPAEIRRYTSSRHVR